MGVRLVQARSERGLVNRESSWARNAGGTCARSVDRAGWPKVPSARSEGSPEGEMSAAQSSSHSSQCESESEVRLGTDIVADIVPSTL